MALSDSYMSLSTLEKAPFFKFAAESGIPGECANDLSRVRPLRSMVLEGLVDGSMCQRKQSICVGQVA